MPAKIVPKFYYITHLSELEQSRKLIFLVFSFTSILIAQNWERTDMGYANTEMFKTTDNYRFIFYNSKSFWNDNLGNYGKNHCKGLAKINTENLFDGGEVYCESIDQKNNKILETSHPSPLSAYRGFFGCKHFSKANKILLNEGIKPIDWQLGE